MSTLYDVIVIGAGPAGLATAAETAGAGLSTLVLDKLGPGGQLINLGALERVEHNMSGPSLVGIMTDDAAAAGAEIGFGEVTKVTSSDNWTVETADGEQHRARAIVVATGFNKGRLGLDDEEGWEGRGLSHCAACDGPLFTGQPVAVVGTGHWVAHEARELAGLAGSVVLVGGDEEGAAVPNVQSLAGRIVGLEGGDGLEAVTVESEGKRQSVPANAVFVYSARTPAAEFVADLLARDAAGHIVVDQGGGTSKPLAFAVGDVVGGEQSVEEARASALRAARSIIDRLKS